MLSRTTRFGNPREAVRDALLGMAQKDVVRFINRYMKSLFVYNSDDLIDEPVDTLVPGPPACRPTHCTARTTSQTAKPVHRARAGVERRGPVSRCVPGEH